MSELETIFQEDIYLIQSPLLIILAKPWEELSTTELDTLTKMLKALKLSLASVKVTLRTEFSARDLVNSGATRVLAFGAILTDSHKQYECENLEGMSVIISQPLDQLDDQKKKSLWSALRAMFSL